VAQNVDDSRLGT